eukprot:1208935-Rhodomonas_salina.3
MRRANLTREYAPWYPHTQRSVPAPLCPYAASQYWDRYAVPPVRALLCLSTGFIMQIRTQSDQYGEGNA